MSWKKRGGEGVPFSVRQKAQAGLVRTVGEQGETRGQSGEEGQMVITLGEVGCVLSIS